MRVDECDMVELVPEDGIVTYRARHRRTGDVVSVHVALDPGAQSQKLVALLQRLPPEERARILDHGQDGRMTYFITQGLPDGEGFVDWLNRVASHPEPKPAPDDAVTPERLQTLRRVFEQARELPREQQAEFLERRCGDDHRMKTQALEMLAVAERSDSFLERPARASELPTQEMRAGGTELTPGEHVGGRYVVQRELGRGGFGVIYLARDLQVQDKPVVLKLSRGDAGPMDAYLMKRFRLEIATMARIVHPGVVGVLDVGEIASGIPYLVMQYVPGMTLRQRMQSGQMPMPWVANVVHQISHALAAAHDKGICHRDLKPENVMLQDLGDGEELAVIIDFGVATMREGESARTQWTRAVGTIAYMPPEQLAGQPTAASDLYALGVMTFEMLAGQRPKRDSHGLRKRLSEYRKGVPKAAENSIMKAMAPLAADRHDRVLDFGDELLAALQPVKLPPWESVLRWSVLVLVGLCIGLGFVVLDRGCGKPEPAPTALTVFKISKSRVRILWKAGCFYLLEERGPGRFSILLPNLSCSDPALRIKSRGNVNYPNDPERLTRAENLWALWSEKPIKAAEDLLGDPQAAPESAVSEGAKAPAIDNLVQGYYRGISPPNIQVKEITLLPD